MTIKPGQACLAALLLASAVCSPAQTSSASMNAAGTSAASEPEFADAIRAFSKRTGRKFIIDTRVRASGAVTGVEMDRITYEQLLALGYVNQFVFVTHGDITLVLPDANARQQAMPVYFDTTFKALDDEWVTLMLTGKNACAAYLVPILRPLMPQAAHLAANPQSNQLIITDRAVNVRRIATLVYQLDEAAPAGRRCPNADANGEKEPPPARKQ